MWYSQLVPVSVDSCTTEKEGCPVPAECSVRQTGFGNGRAAADRSGHPAKREAGRGLPSPTTAEEAGGEPLPKHGQQAPHERRKRPERLDWQAAGR